MAAANPLRQTPLYDQHLKLKARMVDFAGWEMPVQYPTGIKKEHSACRTHMGLFDVSHMGEAFIEGPDAEAFCQRATPNDVKRLGDGQAQYSMLLTEEGGVVDDVLLYRVGPQRFMFCLNASRKEADVAHLRSILDGDVQLEDVSDRTALLALQGPSAIAALDALCPGADLQSLTPFTFITSELLGREVMISRTGYTGEDGAEIFCPNDHAETIWTALMDLPNPPTPVGLGARDTLRLESGYMLYGHELGLETNPLEAGLGWVIKLEGDDFLGKKALVASKKSGLKRRLAHIELTDRGVLRDGCPIFIGDKLAGRVTSGGYSVTFEKSIAMGFIDRSLWESTDPWTIEIRGKRLAAARRPGPVYRRK